MEWKGEVCQNVWALGGVEGRGASEHVDIRWSGRERCVRTWALGGVEGRGESKRGH